MKKIFLLLVFVCLSVISYGQNPFKILNPDIRLKWGIDSVRFDIVGNTLFLLDTLVWPDGTRQWSADSLTPGSEFWKLTGDKLEPKVATNYINTDSAYRIKDMNILKAKGTNVYLGYVTGDSSSALSECTYVGYGSGYLNSGASFSGVGSGAGLGNTTEFFTGIGSRVGYTNTGDVFIGIGSDAGEGNTGDTCIFIGLQAGRLNNLDNWFYLGKGDTNHAIINGEMLTRPRVRINGELYIKDSTVIKETADTLYITSPKVIKLSERFSVNDQVDMLLPYGSYLDTITQTTTGGIKAIRLNYTKGEYEVVKTGDTAITMAHAGKYMIYGRFIIKPSATNKIFNVFVKVNGVVRPLTSTYWTSVGTASRIVPINAMLPFNAGDVISFYWYTDDTGANIETTPKTATMPTSPGVSITINRISR